MCFRPYVKGEDTQLGPLERANPNHPSQIYTAI
jgi:hypothetical protein